MARIKPREPGIPTWNVVDSRRTAVVAILSHIYDSENARDNPSVPEDDGSIPLTFRKVIRQLRLAEMSKSMGPRIDAATRVHQTSRLQVFQKKSASLECSRMYVVLKIESR